MADTPLHITKLQDRGKWNDYRDEIWGDSYSWSWIRQPSEVKYLVIHHSVTKHDATPDDIALLHKARGWAGIGYHFVITKDGTVYYVGDVSTARANVLNMNEKVIGIVLVGDFTKHLPSDEQILSAHDLCQFFLDNKAVWNNLVSWDASVVGHKELQATQCPGNDWRETASSLFNRIKGRIPYSPQEPAQPPAAPNNGTTPTPPAPEPPAPQPEPGDPPLVLCQRELDGAQKKIEDLKKKDYELQSTGTLLSQIIKNITGNNLYLKTEGGKP